MNKLNKTGWYRLVAQGRYTMNHGDSATNVNLGIVNKHMKNHNGDYYVQITSIGEEGSGYINELGCPVIANHEWAYFTYVGDTLPELTELCFHEAMLKMLKDPSVLMTSNLLKHNQCLGAINGIIHMMQRGMCTTEPVTIAEAVLNARYSLCTKEHSRLCLLLIKGSV